MDSDWRASRKAQRRAARQNGPNAAFVGIVIIAVGALFLLQNLGVVYVQEIWQFWPVILIALGISKLVENRIPGGVILVIVGGVFLAKNLGFIYGDVWSFLWPLILIGVGVSMLLRATGAGCGWSPPFPSASSSAFSSSATSASPSSEHVLNIHGAFSAVERRIVSQEFEGGQIHIAFGAAEIDLRSASTKQDEVVLDCHAAFGGIELKVPDAWTVVLRAHGVFGAVENKTYVNPGDLTKKPRLIVTGGAAFGGITVKN